MISVVIPCFNAAATLGPLLAALECERRAGAPIHEIIVVDDCSTDNSAEIAKQHGARVERLAENRGGTFARNRGAQLATGELIWFLDSDCEPLPGTAKIAADFFRSNPQAVAAIGSYDDAPSAPDFVSQFKNLMHHFVHQQAGETVSTFWTGCGFVRRDVFFRAGRFDDTFWPGTVVCDLAFGFQLAPLGQTIHMLKQMQVRHHKRWPLGQLIRTDILERAVPWAVLISKHPNHGKGELNLGAHYKIATAASCLTIIFLFSALVWRGHWQGFLLAAFLSFAITAAAHGSFLRFLKRKRGAFFAVGAVPLIWLYSFYCGIGFLLGKACVFFNIRPRQKTALED